MKAKAPGCSHPHTTMFKCRKRAVFPSWVFLLKEKRDLPTPHGWTWTGSLAQSWTEHLDGAASTAALQKETLKKQPTKPAFTSLLPSQTSLQLLAERDPKPGETSPCNSSFSQTLICTEMCLQPRNTRGGKHCSFASEPQRHCPCWSQKIIWVPGLTVAFL